MAVSHTKIRNKDTPNRETATPNTAPVHFLHYLLPSYSDGMSTGGLLACFWFGLVPDVPDSGVIYWGAVKIFF